MKCAIAIGSNLDSAFGSSQQIVEAATETLDRIDRIQILRVSSWHQTKAVTLSQVSQPDYINGCATLETTLSPIALLTTLLDLEVQFGRIRRAKWDARTLDLDLLLYENCILNTPDLIIPHPRMGDRTFVMLPLAEIAPDWIHPVTGDRVDQMAQNLVDFRQNSNY